MNFTRKILISQSERENPGEICKREGRQGRAREGEKRAEA
jgi:hypothetical protein